MELHLTRLEASLIRQIEAHGALGVLLVEERSALVSLEIEIIHGCARRKLELAEEIRAAENERRAATEALAVAVGLGQRPVRLETLIEHLPEAHRAVLSDLRSRLLTALAAVVDGQGRNRSLAERFLGVLSDSMLAVQRAVSTLPMYSTDARVSGTHLRGCVVSQQA